LVNGGVDDAACENLLCFERQKEHEVVERVNLVEVVAVAGTIKGDKLFTKEFNGRSYDVAKLDVFASVLDGAFYFVHQGSNYGHDKRFG